MLVLLALVVGHGVDEPPAGHTLIRDVGGEVRGAWTSYGLLLPEQSAWRWAAEEAVPADFVWDAAVQDDLILVATSTGVFSSRDGCTWQAQSAHSVRGFARHQGSLFAAVQNARGPGGIIEHQASAWRAHTLWQEGLQLSAIVSDGQSLWATGFDGRRHRLWRNAGPQWEILRTTQTPLRLLGLAGGTIWVATATAATELDAQGAVLREVIGNWVSATSAGPQVLLLRSDSQLFEAPAANSNDSARDLDRAVFRLARDTLGLDRTQAEHHFESTQGQRLVPFDSVLPQECPADSPAGRVSSDIWPILQAQGVGPQVQPGPEDGGCRSAHCHWPGLFGLIGWLFVVFIKRR